MTGQEARDDERDELTLVRRPRPGAWEPVSLTPDGQGTDQ